MELNAQTLAGVTHYLQLTLSPDHAARKEAEAYLASVESTPGYALLLMYAMDQGTVDPAVRQSAAIAFKNLVKRKWESDDGSQLISDADKAAVKGQVVDLMLRLPEAMQKQLSDAIATIGKHDFPGKWMDLFPTMAAKFASADFHVINGVLRTANPLFKRYRYEERSDQLWVEIKLVLEQFAAPLTALFKATLGLLEAHAGNTANVKVLLDSLLLIAKLFYSLNYQDLPEFFEDHMAEWMTGFHTLLVFPASPAFANVDPEKPGVLEELKAQICENVSLYAQKYDEEFASFLPGFINDVWSLLTSLGPEAKFDQLVSMGMGFLSSVAQREHYKQLFTAPNFLSSICEKVVAPNVFLRESDREMFEDDAEEYIRRDIEGSDIDTRRRGACDLVRALCVFWEAEIVGLFSGFVATVLAEYARDPANNWPHKDAAIFIVTSLAVRGQTKDQGATKTTAHINVADFFMQQVAPDLQAPNVNERSVLRADAIKYLMTFRSQIPKEVLVSLLPVLVGHLAAASQVVSTYAAAAIERLLAMRQGAVAVLQEADVAGVAGPLLTHLFAALTNSKHAEDEYVMKCIMRTLATARSSVQPFAGAIVEQLNAKLALVAKNPSRPHFNHFLFESISCAIRNTCQGGSAETVAQFEGMLFPTFQAILQGDVQEFQPYVFQLLAQLLEARPAPTPETYLALFPFLLAPPLWQSSANSAPLVRLVRAYIAKSGEALFVESSRLEAVLGIFQKLVASKLTDIDGFSLLEALVERLPLAALQPYLPTIFSVLFTRLQRLKTVRFVKGMLVFVALLVGKHGGSLIVSLVDSIQAGLFMMLFNRLLEDVEVVGNVARKTCVVGLAVLLTATPETLLAQHSSLWPRLADAAVRLCERADVREEAEEEVAFAEPEDHGYKASYVKLAFAGHAESDPFPAVAVARLHLGQQLAAAAAQHPGVLPARLKEVAPATAAHLQQYVLEAGGHPIA